MPRLTSSRENLAAARKLIRRYLESMGGENNGHTFAWPEAELAKAIAHELTKRDRRAGLSRVPLRRGLQQLNSRARRS